MTTIAFIGLGNMGAGMAANLAKAGHDVLAFDLSPAALERARGAGCRVAASATAAVAGGGDGHHHAAGRRSRAAGLGGVGDSRTPAKARC